MAALAGQKVILIEDEIFIASYLAEEIKQAGAEVLVAYTYAAALQLVDEPGLSAAVIDHLMNTQTTEAICMKLCERGVPFIVFTGHENPGGIFEQGVLIRKPATVQRIIDKLVELLKL